MSSPVDHGLLDYPRSTGRKWMVVVDAPGMAEAIVMRFRWRWQACRYIARIAAQRHNLGGSYPGYLKIVRSL